MGWRTPTGSARKLLGQALVQRDRTKLVLYRRWWARQPVERRLKQASLIVVPLVGAMFTWHLIAAKHSLGEARRELAGEYSATRVVLNAVPQCCPKKLVRAGEYTNTVWMEAGAYALGFPAEQFTRDRGAERGKVMLHEAHYRVLVLPGSEAKEWDEMMGPLEEPNFYSLVLRAFNATESDIPNQQTLAELRNHALLLKVKTMLSCVGFEDSCRQFDRGDMKGFIIGDPARDKHLYVHLFVDHGQKLIELGLLQKAPSQVSDIEAVLSLLKLRRNAANPNGSLAGSSDGASDMLALFAPSRP